MFDTLMQLGQCMIRHHREHMVLNVIVHISVDETVNPVHINRAAVQSMIKYILCKARMLQKARHSMMPRPV